jgi:hypothetical protein
MNAVRGRVRDGRVELDRSLPDGAEVIVVVPDDQEPFDLDPADLDELEARLASADAGDVDPAPDVLRRLRARE